MAPNWQIFFRVRQDAYEQVILSAPQARASNELKETAGGSKYAKKNRCKPAAMQAK
jgi:hypothetical protein